MMQETLGTTGLWHPGDITSIGMKHNSEIFDTPK